MGKITPPPPTRGLQLAVLLDLNVILDEQMSKM